MFKKPKKQKTSILAVGELNEKAIFFCSVGNGQKTDLFLMEKNGLKFKQKHTLEIYAEDGSQESLKGCYDFRFFHSGKKWHLVYSREYSRFFFRRKQTVIAKSSDMVRFDVIDREDGWELESFVSVSGHSHKNNYLAYFGGSSLRAAASNNLRNWHFSGNLIAPREFGPDKKHLHVLDALVTKRGILVLYEPRKSKKMEEQINIGGALFSLDQPYKLLWKSEKPLVQKTSSHPLRYLGCLVRGEALVIFWATKNNRIVSSKIKASKAGVGSLKKRPVHLNRHPSNPIIKPNGENYWEYDSTFNPAAIHLEGKTHLIYRAIGANGVSVFGYASSKDGFSVNERLDKPAFAAMDFSKYSKHDQALYPSKYVSGGSWIGCEDPRVTKIDDRIYMTYTSFDGCNPPGVALTWISVKDFLRKRWTWKRPVLISKPGEIQKNWMLFPEKINGKYAILHSITPQISIEYVDSLEEEGLAIESAKKPGRDEHRWDNVVRGAGAPPIKTEHGWLLLYHAMDKKDPNRYKVGAMILDYADPTKILYRSSCPILEPDAHYENEGAKAGVVYVCGTVIKDGTLFVYYGGADSVVCVATADIKEFLKDISCDVAKDEIVRKKVMNMKRIVAPKNMKKKIVRKKASRKKPAKVKVKKRLDKKIKKK